MLIDHAVVKKDDEEIARPISCQDDNISTLPKQNVPHFFMYVPSSIQAFFTTLWHPAMGDKL
jgi:hypothetical protein